MPAVYSIRQAYLQQQLGIKTEQKEAGPKTFKPSLKSFFIATPKKVPGC